MGKNMPDKIFRCRMDFIPEIISIDDESNSLTILLKPDPRRYEWKEIDEKRYLYDKFDHVLCPEKVFYDLSRQIVNHCISLQSQEIDDVQAHAEFSKPFIEKALKGHKIIPAFVDKSEEFLQSLEVDELTFAIISLDVVGSTALSISLEPSAYANLISVVLWKLSAIIPKFHGHVLKYTGDGLIAYFPEPSFITKNDLAVDCALALRQVIYKGLDHILKELSCPPIEVRIGIDTGEAFIKVIGDPSTKQHKDIIGSVVSLAAKIQAMTKPGEIYVGETTCRNLHTMWKENIELVELNDDWNYKGKDGNMYMIYKIKFIDHLAQRKYSMGEKKQFSLDEAKQIGDTLGIDWDKFDIEQFRSGLEVELEHGQRDPDTNVTNDDTLLTGKIALAHLKEFPDYYTRLAKMEKEAEAFWGKG